MQRKSRQRVEVNDAVQQVGLKSMLRSASCSSPMHRGGAKGMVACRGVMVMSWGCWGCSELHTGKGGGYAWQVSVSRLHAPEHRSSPSPSRSSGSWAKGRGSIEGSTGAECKPGACAVDDSTTLQPAKGVSHAGLDRKGASRAQGDMSGCADGKLEDEQSGEKMDVPKVLVLVQPCVCFPFAM